MNRAPSGTAGSLLRWTAVLAGGLLCASCASAADGPGFDHSSFDALLGKYVDAAGLVDYRALAGDRGELDRYVEALAAAPIDRMDRDARLALLINAYNAFTLRLVIDHYPLESIRDIPAARRWEDVRWNLGGRLRSLDQIEHEEIRRKFDEPRIHFALVCAALGCPPLRREAYLPGRLDAQLAAQAGYVHTHERWFRYDVETNTLELTRLYEWYREDFERAAGSVERYAAAFSPALDRALTAGKPPRIRFLDYDWSLNDRSPPEH